MGCDIHIHTEVLRSGKWWWMDKHWLDPFDMRMDHEEIWEGRNYVLFEILAGVRAGYGSREYEQIADRRGLPSDLSAEVAKLAEGWRNDGHSHSWLSLHDLEAYAEGKKERLREVTDFFDVVIPKLQEMSPYSPHAARIVFWFDC